ncbi:hypothetical protein ASPCAL00060 [Aspergillus calidoustus]|uniref:Zn(2)-C6 fungal-type domain-containing protein n=1 Tax=Aspergillus calidoustus TaxID=454130 RepID=A0A0U5C0C8_ASPCI|nr:hypothetical protein ASPCAL00060 [Aspergillus calidoustus]
MENYAHQACARCRSQKRRCNRLLPICSRCRRLNLPCRYQGIEADPDLPKNEDLSQPILRTISKSVQSHISTIIGDDRAIALSAAVFFSTIHPWFPIVNRASYYSGLSKQSPERSPGFGLLILCTHLLGISPTNGTMSSRMQGLYILATGLAASLTGAEISSIELLQARILLSLFEVGHGPALQVWLRGRPTAVSGVVQMWMTTIAYIALEMGQIPDTNELRISNAASVSTADQDSVLRDLLRASASLEEVLNHIHTPAAYDVKYDEAMPLIQSLVALRDSLVKEGTPPLSCPATALCRSAFMAIMENGYRLEHPPGKDCSPLSIALLQADVDQFVSACEGLTKTMVEGDSINIPGFFVHTTGTAALMISRYFSESRTTNAVPSLQCLKQLLEALSNRWLGAGVYLERIHREQG